MFAKLYRFLRVKVTESYFREKSHKESDTLTSSAHTRICRLCTGSQQRTLV